MNQCIKQLLFILLIQAAFVLGCAGQTNGLKAAFRAADTNQDGIITPEEFQSHAKQTAFESADKNRDKNIDRQEWKAADTSAKAEQNFQAADKNRDQKIHFLEFSDHAERAANFDEVFNSLDRNRDGSLSPDEFNARPAFTILSIKF